VLFDAWNFVNLRKRLRLGIVCSTLVFDMRASSARHHKRQPFLAKYLLERASDGLFIKSVQDNDSFKVNLNLLDTLSKCDISAAGPGDFRVTHRLENRNP
jgi:hypothetical protein